VNWKEFFSALQDFILGISPFLYNVGRFFIVSIALAGLFTLVFMGKPIPDEVKVLMGLGMSFLFK
jgi:hypothetical protein